MSDIRPLRDADIAAVAELFQRVFRDPGTAAPPSLAAYLRRLYLESPTQAADILPLVHVRDDGRISGFIGATALPMVFAGRRLNAAVCGSLMVDRHESDPLAGARLMKAMLAGPQDLTFSETASEISAAMWKKLRGVALPQYSLNWVKIIRPAALALEVAAQRLGAARLLAPLGRGIDRLALGRLKDSRPRWWGVAPDPAKKPRGGLVVSEIDKAAFAGLFAPLVAQFSIRPELETGQLVELLADASSKRDYGDMVCCSVTTRGGVTVGAFVYHGRPGKVARVLQVLAMPGQAAVVIDCLIDHATAAGAAALIGRTQPALMEAMLDRRVPFISLAATVIHSREPELLEPFLSGRGFLNGLAGEQWSRLIGDRFD